MDYLKPIVDFFNHPIFIIVGGITVVYAVLRILYAIGCWIFGISPIVFRLGLSLWRRKVAIFGNQERFNDLKSSLIDSGIFKEKNIVQISPDDIDKAKDETIYLVDWETANQSIDKIFAARPNHHTAVVIFAKPQSIPNERMGDIANRSNTVVVNFKGRLLNDILNSLVTTSFDGR
ncbi:MAG: hypothetical protein KA713_10025 [Chryseotalea sp. WA131a]|jgi:hypothetical protein|nr:MAG: hypothetical protein KA713_10025 [Chryseotalea sp. WA131a]